MMGGRWHEGITPPPREKSEMKNTLPYPRNSVPNPRTFRFWVGVPWALSRLSPSPSPPPLWRRSDMTTMALEAYTLGLIGYFLWWLTHLCLGLGRGSNYPSRSCNSFNGPIGPKFNKYKINKTGGERLNSYCTVYLETEHIVNLMRRPIVTAASEALGSALLDGCRAISNKRISLNPILL